VNHLVRGLAAVTVAVALSAPISAVGAAPESGSSWIVALVEGADASDEAPGMARRYGGRSGHIYEYALTGFQFLGTAQAAANLSRNPRVRTVLADGALRATAETLPTGISRVDGPAALGGGQTGAGTTVAVLDTGIDLDHPDLAGNIHPSLGKDCVNGDSVADDDNGHGTHVAGTIAATDNDLGVLGLASGARLVAIKVLNAAGSGAWSTIICGLDYVTANAGSIDVANMSLSGGGSATGCSDGGLHQAFCAAVGAGVTVVVAAGNDAKNAGSSVPAAYPEAITVSAFSDTNGSSTKVACSGVGPSQVCDEVFAPFSNYGSSVDVMAPGVRINSTIVGGYGSKSGTSMAAPHVAAAAALVASANPSATPAQIAAHLKATGECPDKAADMGTVGCSDQGRWSGDPDGAPEPLINAARAVSIQMGTPPPPLEPPPASAITLSARGYKVKGVPYADLTWAGAASTNVDVYRNGSRVVTTANDGVHTDRIGTKGGGSFTYRVCEAGTATCSNSASIAF
jgi:subtilisin family serine protease